MLPRSLPRSKSLLRSRWKALSSHYVRASFSSSSSLHEYADTINNLRIGKDTRVIFQGFTGKQATANAKESLEWGTNIVGGVRPGKSGEHLGLPVLPSCQEAMKQLKPDATGIYVAAHQAAGAIEEALEAEIPLIVAVAEHIPLHDILRIHSMLKTQSKSRLVGANAPGIISAIGRCRIGFQPLPCFTPGHVGVIAKSGTLSYETVGALTRAGLGQSLSISMGGDVVAGTDLVDGLKVFEQDDDTEGIVLVGEVGGTAEEEAADWIRDYRKRTKNPKPIAALVGGLCAKEGKVMGHAGAWRGIGENTAEQKAKILQDAGAHMVDHPAKFGNEMKKLLSSSGRDVNKIQQSASAASQKRGFHTTRTIPRSNGRSSATSLQSQKKNLTINHTQAKAMLNDHHITVHDSSGPSQDKRLIAISIDRTSRSPCIIASPTTNRSQLQHRVRRFAFTYGQTPPDSTIQSAVEHMQLDAAPPAAKSQAVQLIRTMSQLFHANEAVTLRADIGIPSNSDQLEITNPSFHFDDAAFRSCGRHKELHALRDTSPSAIDPAELDAEKDGIVYVKLHDDDRGANIGTLVNGAGLAMNTVDALSLHHGIAANFLDTGGKATAETVKQSFSAILRDERVRVIFVNIFGGLTLGDMIANGVLLAFKELGLEERGMPVVVRIRGTNEQQGQRIIAESGLKLWAFDDFEEAARKAVELAAR